MRILIVDDSVSVRKALEKILAPQNFEVFAAENAEKALEMIAAVQPALIIADVVMPGMTGFELCQTLKRDSLYQHIPLMLISGIVNANVENQARQVGAAGVIKKPFNPDELLSKVRNMLEKYAPKPAVAPIQPQATIPLQSPTKVSVPSTIKVEAVKPVSQAKAAMSPETQPVTVISEVVQRDLTHILHPVLEKTDVLTILLVDERGHCAMSLGQDLNDRQNLAAYIKFLTSASGVLGENLGDAELKSLVLEYAQRCVVVSRIQKMGLALILKDMSSLSIARYVLKKVTPEITDVLGGKVGV